MRNMTDFGNTIEDYDVGEQLGKGGFAIVRRGTCRRTGVEVAIKMIDIGKIDAGGLTERVRQEVTIHSQLNHPSILKLYTFFEDDHYVYLILELCRNGELQKYIKSLQRNLYENEAREFLSQILSGMLYLQSHSILHRDLTLSNILLDDNGRVKIADFGLATMKRPDDRHTTMCGTPNYMSPEVATRSAHGFQADVWSLGCMLFIMLVGRPPFEGEGAKECIFTRVVIGDYKIPDSVSTNARSLIYECLKKNPKERICLQSILHHPFMNVGTKTDISRMSDSGMYTMSTVTSTNLARMPLPAISEGNASGYEKNMEMEHHSARYQNEALKRHPPSPPVKIRTSPRDLLPQNAGVIDSLKRKYTPLPSLKRTEDFAFTTPSISHPYGRERDVSEEIRIIQKISSHADSSSAGIDTVEHFSSSCKIGEGFKNEFRGCPQRGSSEQNLARNLPEKARSSRDPHSCNDYNAEYYQNSRELESGICILPQSRSYNRSSDPSSAKGHINLIKTVDQAYAKSIPPRSFENIKGHESGHYSNRNLRHTRSKSEERYQETSQSGYGESETKTRGRSHSQDRGRPYSRQDRNYCLERNKEGLGEPEHRSYREKPVDCNTNRHCSCCQHSQHRSWCERRPCKLEKSESYASSSRVGRSGNINATSMKDSCDHPCRSGEKVSDHVTEDRKNFNDKILADIPPIRNVQQSSGEKYLETNRMSPTSKRSKPHLKKVTEDTTQTIQQLVSPLSSKRLTARRQRAKNYFFNIMENGDVCLEVLKGENGREKVIETFRISSDGMRIILYRPNGGVGCQPGEAPPPLPARGADGIYSYENLPKIYWERYRHAAKYIKIVKSQTAKITYFSEQARCTLMENSPDPDFEAVFHQGLKMVSRGKNLVVKEVNGSHSTVPHSSAPNGLREKLHGFYNHFKEVRDHCLYLERVLTEVTEKTGLCCFPVKMGLLPPGKTPPGSAREVSNPNENKENLPLSMQSYRSPRNVSEQLGSFQDSVTSFRNLDSSTAPAKQPLALHTSANIPSESPFTPMNSASRVYVPDIGWAVEGNNGMLSVEYLDGTQVIINSNNPKVLFTDENKVTTTYSAKSILPISLQHKLSQMNVVLSSLSQPRKLPGDAASVKHRFGLR
ncbi:Serine/threonine-protein kinase plk4 [Halocaridina rubra]|uniref:Serine/threonine-protein kinase PLK4 n=1 Tax=Halocaridina rubra TaxID=373956 RepID=A0AAN8WQ85_HALRR